MTTRAVTADTTVIKARGLPGPSGMTLIAFCCRIEMITRLASGLNAVMASRTTSTDTTVIKPGHLPQRRGMTAITLFATDHMVGRLAWLDTAVMTLLACSPCLCMIKPADQLPVLCAVTITTRIGGWQMMRRFSACRDGRTAAMTGITLHRCTLEAAIHMTHFTLNQAMKPFKGKTCRIMIEGCRHRCNR